MKKILFAFIFAILGISVGTIFSRPISNMVDSCFSHIFKAGQKTQKVLVENKEEVIEKKEIQNPFITPTTTPPVDSKPVIQNPFATETTPKPSQTPVSNPFEKADVAGYLNNTPDDNSVGVDSVSGQKVFEDENGFYIIDKSSQEQIDIDQADIDFN